MKFTFNQLCGLLTGCPSDNMLLPEKNADWQYVARQLTSGGAILNQQPDWVVNPTEAMEALGYTREGFQEKYKEFDEVEKAHPDVFNILLQILDDGYLTDSKDWEVVLDSSCDNPKAMNSLYQRLARACLKCSLLQGTYGKAVSPTAWLKENYLSTFEQFCFRFTPIEGCQIED